MVMHSKHPAQESHSTKGRSHQSAWRRDRGSLLAFGLVIIIYGLSAWRDHAKGDDWLTALGFPLDWDFLRIIGDFVVPVVTIVLMMQSVRKLTPSREKTVLTWTGWSLFVFLFLWWSPLRIAMFGTF